MLAQIQEMFALVDLGKINWNQFLEKYLEIAMSIIGKVIVSFLIIAIGFKSLKTIYDSCWSYYTKRSDQKIVSGFQHVAFLKAADVDLQCYDDSDWQLHIWG